MKTVSALLIALVTLMLGLGVGRLTAGSPDSPGGPNAAAAQMFTLDQMYQRLVSGTVSTPMTAFTEPSTPPGTGTMRSLNDLMAQAPAPDNTHGVTRTLVLTGSTYWGLNVASGQWGLQTGTLPLGGNVQGPEGARSFFIPDGVYFTPIISNALVLPKTATANDSDLVEGNIRSGVTIFGVTGTAPPAGVAKTGQTTCYDSAGNVTNCFGLPVDGAQQHGVTTPNPRFVVAGTGPLEGPGTVTDRLTGLIWLRNANCFGQVSWAQGINLVIQINNTSNCGTTFNQLPGAEWRMPNIRELHTLIDYGHVNPALPPNYASVFTNFPAPPTRYWSSTTVENPGQTVNAWEIDFAVGTVNRNQPKTLATYYMWPVRGGS